MKKTLLLFLCACFSNLFSQDTLFLTSGEKQAVKVNEINPTLIKYKRFDNQNGPNYNILKSDVISIKYFGGQVDSFNVISPIAVAITPTVSNGVETVKNIMTCIGNRMFYNEYQIGNEELLNVINGFSDATAKTKMKKCHREMIAHKDIGKTSLVCGLVLGCAAVVATAPFVTGLTTSYLAPTDEGMNVAIVGILCGGAMRFTGFAVSQAQRNKKKAKMREIVRIYNGDYEFK